MIRAAKGTKDILPAEVVAWQYVEREARDVARISGYSEIRTPVLEYTELFARGVGEGTDIVEKEMYTFEDRAGRSITLKPEGTAGVVRAYIESGLANGPQPVKLYYITPFFRYERPQAGRLREPHQFGVEVFGSKDAAADAEVMWIAQEILLRLGLTDTSLLINSLGCERCRPAYTKDLKAYLEKHAEELCGACRQRIDRNPLRVLDCKEEKCRSIIEHAPVITAYLCEDCREHMQNLEAYLSALGLSYTVSPQLVRGLDYYTRTVFEFVTSESGAQSTVCGGGRYDHLVKSLGGPDQPAVGLGMGLERLLLAMSAAGVRAPAPMPLDVYVAVHGSTRERISAVALVRELRIAGLASDVDLTDRSVKAQFKYANKLHARFVLVIGERELESGTVVVKNMESGEEIVGRRERILDLVR